MIERLYSAEKLRDADREAIIQIAHNSLARFHVEQKKGQGKIGDRKTEPGPGSEIEDRPEELEDASETKEDAPLGVKAGPQSKPEPKPQGSRPEVRTEVKPEAASGIGKKS